MRLALLAAAAVFPIWTAGAGAQDINPDRPDLTTSAEVVPVTVASSRLRAPAETSARVCALGAYNTSPPA